MEPSLFPAIPLSGAALFASIVSVEIGVSLAGDGGRLMLSVAAAAMSLALDHDPGWRA
jgi:hypothetical protein